MSLLSALVAPVTSLVSEFIEDKDKSKELETQLKLLMLEKENEVTKKAADIILAEAKSEHWIVASWRPILMLVITAVVAIHYLIFPLLGAFGFQYELTLPSELWTLLQIGVGGYIVGRSGEKMVDKYKQK